MTYSQTAVSAGYVCGRAQLYLRSISLGMGVLSVPEYVSLELWMTARVFLQKEKVSRFIEK